MVQHARQQYENRCWHAEQVCLNRLIQQRAEARHFGHMTSELGSHMLSQNAAAQEVQAFSKELSDANSKLKNVANLIPLEP